jgi:hypothetical protein
MANKWDDWRDGINLYLALPSVVFSYWGFGKGLEDGSPVKIAQALILCFWVIAPPVWFWYEYFFLYKKANHSPEEFDQYKFGIDLSSKIWLALVTVLLGLYFGKDFGQH